MSVIFANAVVLAAFVVVFVALTFCHFCGAMDDHVQKLMTPMMTAFGLRNDDDVIRPRFEFGDGGEFRVPTVRVAKWRPKYSTGRWESGIRRRRIRHFQSSKGRLVKSDGKQTAYHKLAT